MTVQTYILVLPNPYLKGQFFAAGPCWDKKQKRNRKGQKVTPSYYQALRVTYIHLLGVGILGGRIILIYKKTWFVDLV